MAGGGSAGGAEVPLTVDLSKQWRAVAAPRNAGLLENGIPLFFVSPVFLASC